MGHSSVTPVCSSPCVSLVQRLIERCIGPGILPVFADFAPFRRWLRWLPEHKEIDAETAVEEIHYQLKIAMDEDEGTGPWVGLMGFSQGAKVSAALLYDQQLQAKNGTDTGLPAWKFAVLLAGRAPLVSLSAASKDCKALVDAAEISEGFTSVEPEAWDGYEKLKLPTIHVHGLTDPGLHLHRRLLDQYCEGDDARRVIEWEGEHRVPIKSKDVERIVEEIMKVGKETSAIA